jgi:hypothetical protein
LRHGAITVLHVPKSIASAIGGLLLSAHQRLVQHAIALPKPDKAHMDPVAILHVAPTEPLVKPQIKSGLLARRADPSIARRN